MDKRQRESDGLIQTVMTSTRGDRSLVESPAYAEPKQKKYLRLGLIIGAIVLVILTCTLAIVLTNGTSKKPDDLPPFYNPYKLSNVDATLPRRLTGNILIPAGEAKFNPNVHLKSFLSLTEGLGEDHPLKKAVDIKGIPTGVNNRLI